MKLSGDNNVVKLFLSDVKMRLEHHTLVSYTQVLQVLVTLLETVCGVTNLEQVTVIHLRRCVEHLQTDFVSTKSFAVLLTMEHYRFHQFALIFACGKVFFNWCYQEELIEKNPVVRLAAPRPTKRVIPAFSDEQVQKMLACFDLSTEVGFRDYSYYSLAP